MAPGRPIIQAMIEANTSKGECPRASASRETTYVRALYRACLVLGGPARLAEHLGVAEPHVRAWMKGTEEPPQSVFLAAVEIILLHTESAGRAS